MGAVTAAPDIAGFPWPEQIIKAGVKNGITWVAAKAPKWGAVNGYVHIPAPHPWRAYDDGYEVGAAWKRGGLSYFDGEWCGFDTFNRFQYWPGEGRRPDPGAELMTTEKVIGYAKDLAQEAATAVDAGHYNI